MRLTFARELRIIAPSPTHPRRPDMEMMMAIPTTRDVLHRAFCLLTDDDLRLLARSLPLVAESYRHDAAVASVAAGPSSAIAVSYAAEADRLIEFAEIARDAAA